MSGFNSPRKSTRANKGKKAVRFEDETFTPGSNNQHTTGRKIDSGVWIPTGRYDEESLEYSNDDGDSMFVNSSEFTDATSRQHWSAAELKEYYKALTEIEGDPDFILDEGTEVSQVLYDYGTELPPQEPYTHEFRSPTEQYEEMMEGILGVKVKWIRAETRKGQTVQIFQATGEATALNKNLTELAEKYNWYIWTAAQAVSNGLILDYPDEATVENWLDETVAVGDKVSRVVKV